MSEMISLPRGSSSNNSIGMFGKDVPLNFIVFYFYGIIKYYK